MSARFRQALGLVVLTCLWAAPARADDQPSPSLDDWLMVGLGYGAVAGDLFDTSGNLYPFRAARRALHLRLGLFPDGGSDHTSSAGRDFGLEGELDLGWYDRPPRGHGAPDGGAHARVALLRPVRLHHWNRPGLGALTALIGVEAGAGGLWWADGVTKSVLLGLRVAARTAGAKWEADLRWVPAIWAAQDRGLRLDRSETRLQVTAGLGALGIGLRSTWAATDAPRLLNPVNMPQVPPTAHETQWLVIVELRQRLD